MKGVVFITFGQFIEENFGLATWNDMLDNVDLPSGGIYTAVGSYDDSEIMSLVGYFCEKHKVEPAVAVKQFGQYMFGPLSTKYSHFIQEGMSLKEFLISVDNIIHVEVKKLYPDSNLPTIDYDQEDKKLIMVYQSPRKLCHLAEGLIEAAAEKFGEQVEVSQSQCMHNGADKCHIEVNFVDKS